MTANQVQTFLTSKGSGLAKKSWNGKRASDIIYQAAQDWGINPQVILATLQKEQSLVTDPNPDSVQLRSAMGYGCPDNGSCSSDFSGFSYQVNNGTWQLRFNFERAKGNDDWYNSSIRYACNQTTNFYSAPLLPGNTVTFKRNTAFSGTKDKTITIANAATASMYCYTPHVGPYSETGYSGSYNFVTSFESWFGSTQAQIGMTDLIIESQPFTDAATTIKFSLTNYTKTTLNLGTIGIAARDPNNLNVDFDYIDKVTIQPGKTFNYTGTKTLNGAEGEYHFWVGRRVNNIWQSPTFGDFNQSGSDDVYKDIGKKPTLTSSLQLSPTVIHANESFTPTFTIKNNSLLYSLTLNNVGVSIRNSKGKNYDAPYGTNVTIAAGQTYTFSQPHSLPSGNYQLQVTTNRNGYGWSYSFPENEVSGLTRALSISVKNQVTMTSGLSIDTVNGHAGNITTGTFTIKNFGTSSVNIGDIGIAVRNQKNQNYDLPYATNVSLAAGQELTVSKSRSLPAGAYHFWVANYRNGQGWSNTYPVGEDVGITRAVDISIKDQLTLVEELGVDTGNGHGGNDVASTFKVKNFGSTPLTLNYIGVSVRDSNGKNYDFPYDTDVSIAAGQTYTFNKSRLLPAGSYQLEIATHRDGYGWTNSYPTNETTSLIRTKKITLKDQVTMTGGLSIDAGNGHAGAIVTGAFTIKNYGTTSINIGDVGIAVRNQKNQNYDLPYATNVTLAPGQELTVTKSRALPAGTYHFWTANYRNGYGWKDNYPSSEDGSVARSVNITILP